MYGIYPKIYGEIPLMWAHDFLRNPKDFPDRVDINYLTNQRSAALLFFEWFIHGSPTSYEEMLRTAHRVAACGPHGGNYYRIPAPDGHFLIPSRASTDAHIIYDSPRLDWVRETFPGAMRSDLEARRIQHPTKDILTMTDDELAILEKLKAYANAKSQDSSSELSDALSQKGQQRYYINFRNCFVRCLVIRHSRRKFSRRAPSGSTVSCLLINCSEALKRCRSFFLKRQVPELLNELLGYYHMAINLMPFANINNSIFMGQVNIVMRLAGFQPLPHSSLDSFALILPHDLFARAVTATHPELAFINQPSVV
jgi:hypothetical protein